MKMLPLTEPGGGRLWLAPEHIVGVRPRDDGSEILTSDGTHRIVTEDPDSVVTWRAAELARAAKIEF